MCSYISRVNMTKEVEDIQEWDSEDFELFSMKSAYHRLANHASRQHDEVFTCLWKAKALPNVLTTTWRVLLDKIPSRMCLRRREVLVTTTLCGMCGVKDESSKHLFLGCKHALSVWSLCFIWIDILFVQHNVLKCHFENFHLVQVSNKQNLVWKGLWTSIVWSIWEQGNNVIFKQGIVDVEEIFHKAQLKSWLWLWLKHKVPSYNFSFVDWVLNPLPCIMSFW